tara:strand:- start:1323 stop:2177 length:855 start_codon:yes stop_codon:yes gene_type:complete
MEKNTNSPFKIAPALIAAAPLISAGASMLGSVISGIGAGRRKRQQEKKLRREERKQRRLLQQMDDLDISNPYAGMQNVYRNMENVMEDLTINQKQAQFEREQFQQSQANIMQQFRGAAGGSGIAALAQSLAQQGQIAAQRSSASIGQQEAMNQRLRAQEASRLQTLELGEESRLQNLQVQGDLYTRQKQEDRLTTKIAMSQQRGAAAAEAAGQANQAKWSAIGGAITGAADMYAGFGGGQRPLLDFGAGGYAQQTPQWLQNQFDAYAQSGATPTLGPMTVSYNP